MAEWSVLLPEHHTGYIDWPTFQANQARIDANVHPQPHQAGGAVREGAALLQGLATCGKCGRRLHTHYTGRNAVPGYHCSGKNIVEGRGLYCLHVGGVQIDQAVVDAFLQALTPAALEATDELRARFVEQAPPDYLPMLEATMKLGVSRQTVLQRVKRGEIEALLVTRGRRKGLRIKVVDTQPGLFHQ
jgi:hypothetical protein